MPPNKKIEYLTELLKGFSNAHLEIYEAQKSYDYCLNEMTSSVHVEPEVDCVLVVVKNDHEWVLHYHENSVELIHKYQGSSTVLLMYPKN